MTEYHVAIDRLASPDPDTSEQQVETTYLGVVDQAHVDEVRAIAALKDSPRFVKDHPHIEGAFCVLRDDGDLDVYVPVDAAEYRVYEPDENPRSLEDTGGEEMGPRGTTAGPSYVTGAVKFGDQSIGGAMDYPGNPPRVVWHTTESPSGAGYFTSVAAYLIRVASEPQVIYDPASDKIGQFGPLTQSARALQNDGSRRTNREGRVCIQVEVLGKAASPWTKGFDPSAKPNFKKLLSAARAHGVPDAWPAGKPLATATAVAKATRDRATWQSKGGHFSHGQVPGNSHWDPGAIDTAIVPGKAVVETKPGTDTGSSTGTVTYTVKDGDTLTSIAKAHNTTVAKLVSLNGLKDADKLTAGQKLKVPAKAAAVEYEPFPGSSFFHGGRHSPIITAMGRRLVAEGCGRYNSGPGPDWTNADRASFAAWQHKYSKEHHLGWSDADCDGIPGKTSWAALKVPKV